MYQISIWRVLLSNLRVAAVTSTGLSTHTPVIQRSNNVANARKAIADHLAPAVWKAFTVLVTSKYVRPVGAITMALIQLVTSRVLAHA